MYPWNIQLIQLLPDTFWLVSLIYHPSSPKTLSLPSAVFDFLRNWGFWRTEKERKGIFVQANLQAYLRNHNIVYIFDSTVSAEGWPSEILQLLWESEESQSLEGSCRLFSLTLAQYKESRITIFPVDSVYIDPSLQAQARDSLSFLACVMFPKHLQIISTCMIPLLHINVHTGGSRRPHWLSWSLHIMTLRIAWKLWPTIHASQRKIWVLGIDIDVSLLFAWGLVLCWAVISARLK